MMRRLFAAAGLALVVLLSWYPHSGIASGYDWLQFCFDQQHSGNNTQETSVTAANVGRLQKLFSVSLPSIDDGAVAYLSAVTTPGGVKDLVFLTTKDGHILALDAHSGAQVWEHQYGPGTCHINNGSSPCYTTSSPAIDPNRQYVYSYGLDGYVHKYQVGDGMEVSGNGWPELATLKPYNEKGSSALSIATDSGGTSYLYVASAGYPGDQGDYQGHVTAINLSSGAQQVFNTVCSNQAVHFVETPGTPDCSQVQTAVWARPGTIYDSDTGKIYFGTGNGTYNPGSYDWGDSVLAINPNGTGVSGNPLDSYTPTDYAQLQSQDADLGSTAPAILPTPANSVVRHLAVQGGKDALLRLINLDNLSGQGAPGHTDGEIGQPIGVPQGGEVLTQPAVRVNPQDGRTWVFVANGSGISGLQLVIDGSGNPSLHPVWTDPGGGTSPIVVNGLLFYAGSGSVQALDPLTGSQLWHDTSIGGVHWESPIVANGVLYITDESRQLTAYTLPSSPPPTNTPTPTPTPVGQQSIVNGGFETGDFTGWTRAGTTSIVSPGHTGSYAAQVGGTSPTNGDSSISQTFTASSSGGTLAFWYQVHCPDTVQYDWATATLKDNTTGTTSTILAKTCSNTGSWVQKSATATAGHSYTLTLISHDDNYPSDPTYTLYDDVTLSSAPPPPNDFSISANPTSVSVGQGASNSSTTISTAVTSGSAQTVSLSASGQPSGVTVSFNPSSVTAGGSSTLTITVGGSTPTGTSTITVTGTGTSATHSTSFSLTVTASGGGGGIVNGGFEMGTLSGWTSAGTTGIVSPGHTGSYAARVGGTAPTNGDSSIKQTFTAPTGITKLSFWYKVVCPDTVTYDWARATLRDNTTGTTATVLVKTCSNAGSWVQASGNVTAGHSYTLTLVSHDDNYPSDPTYTLYDDVALS